MSHQLGGNRKIAVFDERSPERLDKHLKFLQNVGWKYSFHCRRNEGKYQFVVVHWEQVTQKKEHESF